MNKPLLFLFALPVVLIACATPNVTRFERVLKGSEHVVFDAVEFRGKSQEHIRHTGLLDSEEYVFYMGGGARAELIYMEATKDSVSLYYNHIQAERIEKTIDTWNYNKKHTKNWGLTKLISTPAGEFYYKPYRLEKIKQPCFGFSTEWDYPADDSFDRPGKVMFGYLCVNENKKLNDENIRNYIQKIKVTDYVNENRLQTNKQKDKNTSSGSAPDNTALAHTVKNGLAHSSGNSKFPFELGHIYTVGNGNGDLM